MYYPQELIEQIRVENDIVTVISSYVALKQKGNSYFGLCPFHNESTPSFSVSPDKQLYHCFGCGASGNVFSFVMEKEGYDFKDAIKVLAERVRIDLPEPGDAAQAAKISAERGAIYEMHKIAARYFYDILQSDEGTLAREYIDKRNLSQGVRKKFGIGYASEKWDGLFKVLAESYDNELILKSGLVLKGKSGQYYDRFRNRLMIPIFDVTGKVIAFGGRIIGKGEPKYLNSPETMIFEKSKNLYALNFAKGNKELILVEGYMDVISLYQMGIRNAVAALGTAFNENHVKTLNKYAKSVILLFDSDEAGEKAAIKAVPIILKSGMKVSVIRLEGAKDPDEFMNKFGADLFHKALQEPMSHVAFNIKTLLKKYNLEDNNEKIDFTREVSKILSGLPSAIERDVYVKEASAITGISENAIKEEIEFLNRNSVKRVNTQIKTNYEYAKSGKLLDKGLYEAKKGVIYLAASSKSACEVLKKHISPPEMGDDIYGGLLKKIYALDDENKNINPADLVSYFEDSAEQKVVSDIFTTTLTPNDIKNMALAVNDRIKLIKKSYIDREIQKSDDMEELKRLLEEKRNIESLNITLNKG